MGPETLERSTVIRVLRAAICHTIVSLCLFPQGTLVADQIPPAILVVLGAEGTADYGAQFREWAEKWEDLARSSAADMQTIGITPSSVADRDQLQLALQGHDLAATTPLLLVLIGHGTARNDTAKFNLVGPDVTAVELTSWVAELQRPLAVVIAASCSGAFLQPLAAENRYVITATQSGAEQNFSRFGGFFAQALSDPAADLDHDETISLLETFLLASHLTARFYEQDDRLATEHALLDDNGDGRGTPADFFRGIRVTKSAEEDLSPDGLRAHQVILSRLSQRRILTQEQTERHNQLEQQIEQLLQRKASLKEEDYFAQLETLLIELARLNCNAGSTATPETGSPATSDN